MLKLSGDWQISRRKDSASSGELYYTPDRQKMIFHALLSLFLILLSVVAAAYVGKAVYERTLESGYDFPSSCMLVFVSLLITGVAILTDLRGVVPFLDYRNGFNYGRKLELEKKILENVRPLLEKLAAGEKPEILLAGEAVTPLFFQTAPFILLIMTWVATGLFASAVQFFAGEGKLLVPLALLWVLAGALVLYLALSSLVLGSQHVTFLLMTVLSIIFLAIPVSSIRDAALFILFLTLLSAISFYFIEKRRRVLVATGEKIYLFATGWFGDGAVLLGTVPALHLSDARFIDVRGKNLNFYKLELPVEMNMEEIIFYAREDFEGLIELFDRYGHAPHRLTVEAQKILMDSRVRVESVIFVLLVFITFFISFLSMEFTITGLATAEAFSRIDDGLTDRDIASMEKTRKTVFLPAFAEAVHAFMIFEKERFFEAERVISKMRGRYGGALGAALKFYPAEKFAYLKERFGESGSLSDSTEILIRDAIHLLNANALFASQKSAFAAAKRRLRRALEINPSLETARSLLRTIDSEEVVFEKLVREVRQGK